jgi:hypothetical protein
MKFVPEEELLKLEILVGEIQDQVKAKMRGEVESNV